MNWNEDACAFCIADAITMIAKVDSSPEHAPWWATGEAGVWTPVCLSDATPLRGADRALAALASITFGRTTEREGHWWHEVSDTQASQTLRLSQGRLLRPWSTQTREQTADDTRAETSPSAFPLIIAQLLSKTDVAITWSHVAAPTPTDASIPTVAVPASGSWGQTEKDLIALVWSLCLASSSTLGSDEALGRVGCLRVAELSSAYVLARLGVDPQAACATRLVLPPKCSGDSVPVDECFPRDERQFQTLAHASEHLSETLVVALHAWTVDPIRNRPDVDVSAHAPTAATSDAQDESSPPGVYTLDQAIVQARYASKMLHHPPPRL